MTKIKIEVEFEVDDSLWGANSEDQEERDWFWKEILPSATLILHSNEVGDEIASTNNFTINENTEETKEEDTEEHPILLRSRRGEEFIGGGRIGFIILD
jgi:hypothetical protein